MPAGPTQRNANFWHGAPSTPSAFAKPTARHAWPKTLAASWLAKITSNKAHDRKANRILRAKGWKVIHIWEHEMLNQNLLKLLWRLETAVTKCQSRPYRILF